ncbi:MAG TPA: hypothetical protein DD733_02840, partial [Clostridiales bacterium]|nr:hypothetical protein [Clostridiales bacterium]
MKRIKRVSLLVVLILLVGLLPQVTLKVNAASYSVSTAINGINVVRNTNYMVVYNVRGSNTNTNIYGYEVVVTAGVVTSVGGNNNSIPSDEGSFVVSGHGTSIEWLKKNVLIGMKASYTNKSVTFTYDNDTLLTHLDLKILAMKDAYFNARSTYRIIDYSGLMQRIEAVDDEYELLLTAYNSDKSYDLSKNSAPLFAEITEIKGLCSESSGVEMRGVWIRPTQTTTTAVENYVQQLYDAGINMICIETLYSSTMIMPMPEDSLFEQNPLWKGFDMLQAFIDACHSRDMELHIWMPVYYVGHGLDNTACVGVKKPEWRTVSNTGQYYSPGDESKFVFLSPANPEVKKFLIDTYRYILTKYDIDGFQLDYIRYYSSGEVDFGYDSITTSAFRAKYCVTPSYNKKASYWDDWVAFRAGFVTDMVKSVRNLIDEVNPDVLLSADVSAYYESGYENIYQDSVTWLREGYLDMIHPMAYGIGYTNLMEDFVNIAEDCYVGVGLGAYLDMLSSEDLAEQAEDMARIGASGSVFFEASAFLRKEVGEILNKSLYRNRAIPPTLN